MKTLLSILMVVFTYSLVLSQTETKVEYYSDGKKKSETDYINDIQEGKCVYWRKNGEIREELNYVNGKIEIKETITESITENSGIQTKTITKWYDNGKKKSEVNWINDKKEGKYIEWYETGEIREEVNYVNDKREGKCNVWYETGEKRHESYYVNNEKHGKSVYWHKNGKIELELGEEAKKNTTSTKPDSKQSNCWTSITDSGTETFCLFTYSIKEVKCSNGVISYYYHWTKQDGFNCNSQSGYYESQIGDDRYLEIDETKALQRLCGCGY